MSPFVNVTAMAPGWIVVPAVLVLGYCFLVLREEAHGGVAVAWQGVCSIAGLAAFGAVIWWAGTMFGIS
jgi:hypothetical protein